MFTLHLYLLATLAIVSSSKCPEDPFACLLKKHSQQRSDSQFFTSITLQESNGEERSTGETIEGQFDQQQQQHHQHQHQHHQQQHQQQQQLNHQDGRFSLNDTQAAGCELNGTTGCRKCSKCPKNGKIVRTCSTSHDTICICERGTYLDVLAYECKPCSPCPHGHGVWKKCNRHHDTVCRSCMPGFYSGVISNELGCSPCDKCTSNQIMLQECSRIENTVCIDRSIGKRNHFAQTSSGGLVIGRKDNNSTSLVIKRGDEISHEREHPHPQHSNNGGDFGVGGRGNNGNGPSGGQKSGHYYDYSTSQASLHIYFAILVVIICCVFFYVLLKWRLHQMAKSAPFKSQFGNIYISKTIRPANLNSLYSPLPQHQQQQSPNSGFLVNHQTLRSPSQGTPFAQVKQEPPAITASDCYRLLGVNSPAHRPNGPVQLQQQTPTPPHLVITWSEKRHKAKCHEANCYLNRPPPFAPDHSRHQRSSK